MDMDNEFEIITMDDDFSDTQSQAEEWGVEAKSNRSCESDTSDDTPVTSEAIKHIEELVLSFLTQLVLPQRTDNPAISEDNCQKARSKLKQDDKVKPKVEIMLVDRKRNTIEGTTSYKCIRYPKKSSTGSARPLAQLMRLLDLTHEAILDDLPATKRDIFYKDVALFKTQRVVDNLVDDLAATFQIERSDLNIRASTKGLISGAGLTIRLSSGEVIQLIDTEGSIIPAGEDIESFSVDEDVAWVLIVEKEAVFQTLCRLGITDGLSLPGRGLLLTGKGYPDVATRHLVKSLADALPRTTPIMALVDGDPYGLDILSVYKYGSLSLQHESGKLASKRIKWLGIWASELETLGIDRDNLLPISKHDEKKALSMLLRPTSQLPEKWKKELMHMLHSRRKAEIEILSNVTNLQFAETFQRNSSEDKWLCSAEAHDILLKRTHFPNLSNASSSLVQTNGSPSPLSRVAPSVASSAPPGSHGQNRAASRSPLLCYLNSKISQIMVSSLARSHRFVA